MVASKTDRKIKGRKKKIYSGRSGAQSKYSDDLGHIRGPNLSSNVVRSGAKSKKEYIDASTGRASFSRSRMDEVENYVEGGRVSSPRPKLRPFEGISEDTEKAIEDALSEAMSDPKKNPTSRYNTLKGRNNTMKRKKRSEVERFAMGGDVRFNSNRGKTY